MTSLTNDEIKPLRPQSSGFEVKIDEISFAFNCQRLFSRVQSEFYGDQTAQSFIISFQHRNELRIINSYKKANKKPEKSQRRNPIKVPDSGHKN